MALQPKSYAGQEILQPGARGEQFQANMPGYRDQSEDRVNRTNNKLNTNAHDVPNIKYEFDRRLPVLFRYGFAYGYNQIVIPKGRLVSADPFMDQVDFDMHSQNNTLTLSNGGAPVRLRKTGDVYHAGAAAGLVSTEADGKEILNVGKDWMPLMGMTDAYSNVSFRPLKTLMPLAQLASEGYGVDEATGKIVGKATAAIVGTGTVEAPEFPAIPAGTDLVRPANTPLGILSRNEYTRNDDAYNGIMPGAVLTDAMVELPWFAFKNKAEANPWGSAYGGLFPGALVKSDENGRFVVSPLSFPESEMIGMSMAEYEAERQQVVGQVYSVNNSLIPEGAAKWATWALSDRLGFQDFNPSTYRQNNRDGEDAINNSPYNSDGTYPGYPYDRTIGEHDLHMLASTIRNAGSRMPMEHQYENLGIPGLTDGKNVATRTYAAEKVGTLKKAAVGIDYVDAYFKTSEIDVVELEISVDGGSSYVPCVKGPEIATTGIAIKYADALQGLIVLEFVDKTRADAFLATDKIVMIKFKKKGLAGVPTFLDWDGAVGSVKVLLSK